MKGKVKVTSSKLPWVSISGSDIGVGQLRITAVNADVTGSEPVRHSPEGRAWAKPKLLGLQDDSVAGRSA